MEIQGSINQLLALATVASKISPQVEKLSKGRELAAQTKALTEQRKALPLAEAEEIETGSTAAGMAHKKLLEAEAEVSRKKFELSPSRETAREMIFSEAASTGKPITTPTRVVNTPEDDFSERIINGMERDEIAREEAARNLNAELRRLRSGNEVVRPSGVILTPPSIGTRR